MQNYPNKWFSYPKKSILSEGQFAKKFEFFTGKFNNGCYKLVEMCKLKDFKNDFYLVSQMIVESLLWNEFFPVFWQIIIKKFSFKNYFQEKWVLCNI